MGGINVKNTMLEAILQKIAPHPCFGCGKVGMVLCNNCKYDIIQEPFCGCILCGNVSFSGVCVEHDVPICKAWVVGERTGPLKAVTDAYKFQFVKAAAFDLIDLLDDRLPILPANTIIVPIPTITAHVRQRGFDHIDRLARVLALRRGWPVAHLLERESTKTQHQLNKADRQTEATKAFIISNKAEIHPTAPILLLDDTITTGSTISSAARVLSDAGAKNIFVAALAYQPLD